MEETIATATSRIRMPRTNRREAAGTISLTVENEAVEKLISEGGEDFYNFVESEGLSEDSNLIVLSSQHHYYYDSEEMDNAKTVINLKELNLIKEIKSFLFSHLYSLPAKCNFVGCFVNNKKVERFTIRMSSSTKEKNKSSDEVGLGIILRFPFINKLYSLLDSKTDDYMSTTSVASMLAEYGFKIIKMKELNGLTYFHSRKAGEALN